MSFAVNKSPLAGREGDKLTSRVIRDRLMKELDRNVALQVEPQDSGDAFTVSGRGPLHLTVLIETMRREGFELEIGPPEVIIKTGDDGKKQEPYDAVEVQVPDEYASNVVDLLNRRKGEMQDMGKTDVGDYTYVKYLLPTRGSIGLRTNLLSATRGTAVIDSNFDSYRAFAGDIEARDKGQFVGLRGRRGHVPRVVRCAGSRPIVRDAENGRLQGHGRGGPSKTRRPAGQRLQAEAADEHAERDEGHRRRVKSASGVDSGFGGRVHLRGGAVEVTPVDPHGQAAGLERQEQEGQAAIIGRHSKSRVQNIPYCQGAASSLCLGLLDGVEPARRRGRRRGDAAGTSPRRWHTNTRSRQVGLATTRIAIAGLVRGTAPPRHAIEAHEPLDNKQQNLGPEHTPRRREQPTRPREEERDARDM